MSIFAIGPPDEPMQPKQLEQGIMPKKVEFGLAPAPGEDKS